MVAGEADHAMSADSAVDQTARNNANLALEKNSGAFVFSSNTIFSAFGTQWITKAGKMASLHLLFRINNQINQNNLIGIIPSGFRPYATYSQVPISNATGTTIVAISINTDGGIYLQTTTAAVGVYALDFSYPVA